jgi:hypothetical protein
MREKKVGKKKGMRCQCKILLVGEAGKILLVGEEDATHKTQAALHVCKPRRAVRHCEMRAVDVRTIPIRATWPSHLRKLLEAQAPHSRYNNV